MRRNAIRWVPAAVGAAIGWLVCTVAMAQEPGVVATALGTNITWNDLASQTDDRPRARKLLASIWEQVAPHYIESRGLKATSAEIAELAAYDKRFEAEDRSKRARKLEELDNRLLSQDLAPDERVRLQEFRATLRRLAIYDRERDEEPLADPARQAATYASWVELWKMNKALYDEYGGVVGRTAFGPDPHGARAALLQDYQQRGLLSINDAALRDEVLATLRARPAVVLTPEQVDFTPYWRRPIPPSYFPD